MNWIRNEVSFSDESASLIEKRMQELVEEDIPIEKYNMRTEEALEHFEQQKRMDKVNLIKYRRSFPYEYVLFGWI